MAPWRVRQALSRIWPYPREEIEDPTDPRRWLTKPADQGFLNLFNGEQGHDAAAIVDHLAAPWDLAGPGPIFKIYPCCGLVHSGLDAVLALRTKHGFTADEVESVRILVHDYVPRVMHVTTPSTGYAAKFSVPYCIAAAIRDGVVNLATFDTVDPDLAAWSKRIAVEVHPDLHGGGTFLAKEFTEVEVTTAVASSRVVCGRPGDGRGLGG